MVHRAYLFGFERKVAESLKSRIEAFEMGEVFGEILVPTEDVVEMKGESGSPAPR